MSFQWQQLKKKKQIDKRRRNFKVTSEVGGELQEEGDKNTVGMKTVPDGLLVLLVLFTVDYFYPVFSCPRTSWETANKLHKYNVHGWSIMVLYMYLLVCIHSYCWYLCIYSLHLVVRCTFYVKHSCQWYVRSHHSLVLGTWVNKKKKKKEKWGKSFISLV